MASNPALFGRIVAYHVIVDLTVSCSMHVMVKCWWWVGVWHAGRTLTAAHRIVALHHLALFSRQLLSLLLLVALANKSLISRDPAMGRAHGQSPLQYLLHSVQSAPVWLLPSPSLLANTARLVLCRTLTCLLLWLCCAVVPVGLFSLCVCPAAALPGQGCRRHLGW